MLQNAPRAEAETRGNAIAEPDTAAMADPQGEAPYVPSMGLELQVPQRLSFHYGFLYEGQSGKTGKTVHEAVVGETSQNGSAKTIDLDSTNANGKGASHTEVL